ncbi:Uncharacterised protein [Mycobacteroides abscessus subsp. abscessus]|nr:Uncharacterised protein [Mycobacteroides abscessus subsp. abscessus]
MAPRQRVPAIGCVVATRSVTVTSASGLDPTIVNGVRGAPLSSVPTPGMRSRYIYGLGLEARRMR